MKTETEQRHDRSPPLQAEPKLRRLRKKFFSEKNYKKNLSQGYSFDFVYFLDFDFEFLKFFIFFNYLFHREIKVR